MLELDRLIKRFGAVTALDDLSFSVPRGQVFGFLGPNGSGKTTAMRIAMGIAEPDAGEVRWDGHPVCADDRLRFGYLPEERGLYGGMVVVEQLEYLARLHGMDVGPARQAAEAWLGRLGLGDRLKDRVQELSLGNQQRVQLAAALVHEPELLVLDEPFSGLDPAGIDALAAVLREQADNGAAVLFSSHQLDLVENICEAVAIVNRGRVVATGTVDELATAGARQLSIEVAGGEGGRWLTRLRKVKIVDDRDGRLRLSLDGTDPQRVLAAAQRAGEVTHFSFERKRLSEVFREAVRGK